MTPNRTSGIVPWTINVHEWKPMSHEEDVATRAKDRPSSVCNATLSSNGGEQVRVTSVEDGHDTIVRSKRDISSWRWLEPMYIQS